MTPHRGPLSDNGRALFLCLLFPLFWPLVPALLACRAAEAIRDAYWRWQWRRASSAEQLAKQQTAQEE